MYLALCLLQITDMSSQYIAATCTTCTASLPAQHLRPSVGPFQLPAPQSGTLSRILSRTRPSVETVSDVCLKRICSLNTSAFSALEVPNDKFTYLLTCLLHHGKAQVSNNSSYSDSDCPNDMTPIPVEEIENKSASQRRLVAALVDGDIVWGLRLGIQRQNVHTKRLRQPPAHQVPQPQPEMIRPRDGIFHHHHHQARCVTRYET